MDAEAWDAFAVFPDDAAPASASEASAGACGGAAAFSFGTSVLRLCSILAPLCSTWGEAGHDPSPTAAEQPALVALAPAPPRRAPKTTTAKHEQAIAKN
jgi:hypothetical protein